MSSEKKNEADFTKLLPDEILVTQFRRPGPAETIDNAPSLRIAAAEIIREGYLLHYAEPRYYEFDDDDLQMLAGDRMYSAGLDIIAAEGDVEAVVLLARLIAGCSEAQALGEPERAEALWTSTLAMLARGSGSDGQA